jgi:co-chaperonin GroES (HSP10)
MTDTPLPEQNGLPIPHFKLLGKAVMVYQDAAEEDYGKIIIPDTAKRKPGSGIVVAIGDGYDPNDPVWEAWDPTVEVGDRVLWSSYDEMRVRCRVDDEWWEDNNRKNTPEHHRKVEFVLLAVQQVVGIVTGPEAVGGS